MLSSESIFLYSRYIPLTIQENGFNLILFGDPGKTNSLQGKEDWIKEILTDLVRPLLNLEEYMAAILRNSRGLFLLIIISEDKIILASDLIRSFPIFYGYHQNRFFITDNLHEFQIEKGPFSTDFEKFEEIFSTGLIYRNRTIYKNVFGLQAAEIKTFTGNEMKSVRYFTFKSCDKPQIFNNIAEFSHAFDERLLLAFSRLIAQKKDVNKWIVPLSGGHDSRLIVNYLNRLGVRNVICYSYGNQGNEQSRISKLVAQTLGYEWHFIEYSGEKWKDLFDKGIFGKYLDFAFNGVSTPHIQDLLAVYELRTKGILNEGDVFLPGHTVVTETVFGEETLKLKNMDDALLYVYSHVKVMTDDDHIEPKVFNQLRKLYSEMNITPENFMAVCDWQERQAKFITNSIKVYEFFGFQSCQPMWDMELVDFWLKIPAKNRVGRDPLYQAEKRGILIEKLIPLPYAAEHKITFRIILSGILKRVLPEKFYTKLLRLFRLRSNLNEGLNHVYELMANKVSDILEPLDDFPPGVIPYFSKYLERSPYQVDPNKLTTLYTARKLLDKTRFLDNSILSSDYFKHHPIVIEPLNISGSLIPLEFKLVSPFWTSYRESEISVDFIGYLDYEDNLILNSEDLFTLLVNQDPALNRLIEFITGSLLKKANGNFAIILNCNGKSLIACDSARTYPLYIVTESSKLVVTDHLGEIKFPKETDEVAMEEFLVSGLVTGHRTVFKNVSGLLAGEFIIFDGNKVDFRRYFKLRSYPLRIKKEQDNKSAYIEMDRLFLSVFNRMIRSCPDVNNWVVPLSGGHDSRLIINYLHRLGCKNVICYTYGESSSKEAKHSKLAAEVLGYKWYFIEYTAEELGRLHTSGILDQFISYSFNGCCLPHAQDMVAVQSLKERGIIGEKDVIVPGHTAFTEAEDRRLKELKTIDESLVYIYKRYYTGFKCDNNFPVFKDLLNNLLVEGEQDMNSFPEYFNWQERQSKFINNSVRLYEFYGLRWRMPLWEKCVIDFWQSLNFDDRISRRIFFKACYEDLYTNSLKTVPVIDKFQKPRITRRHFYCLVPQILISFIVRILDKKTEIAEMTNLIFSTRAKSVGELAGSLKMYPPNLKKKIAGIKPRRLYQINYCLAMAICTLQNEVISRTD